MLLVLVPTPYVDASTAWSFPSKWERIFVGAAGMIVELFVAALCAFVWRYTNADDLSAGQPTCLQRDVRRQRFHPHLQRQSAAAI